MIFWLSFSILCLGITCIIQTFWLRGLSKRLSMIEHASFLRAWLEAIEDNESLSDMAYMKEKGFLK